MKYYFFIFLIDGNIKNLMNTRKTKNSEGYDMYLEPWFDTNLCEPRGHANHN